MSKSNEYEYLMSNAHPDSSSLHALTLGWQLFENSPDCVKLLSSEGQLLAMNINGQCAMDIDAFKAMEGTPFRSMWPTASHGDIAVAMAAAVAGRTGRFQGFCPTVKGKPKWWDVTINPIAGPDGEPTRLLVVSRDMTDAHHAQRSLQASEARFRSLVMATSAIVWHCTAEQGFKSEQPAWTAFTGQTFDAYQDDGWLAAVHPDDRAATRTAWLEACATRSIYHIEHRLRRADGAYRHMNVKAVPIFDAAGALVEWVGVHTDVTASVDARAALHESRERFEKIVSQAATGVVELDTTGRITFANQKYAAMLGYVPEELVGRSVIDVTAPDSIERTLTTVRTLLADGVEAAIDKHYLRKDGSWMPATSSINILRGPDGETLGLVAIVLDTTESKRADDTLRKLAADLVEANRRKTEFLATLAHELRNPLAPIRSGLGVLRLSGDTKVAVTKVREMMERQVGHMVHLIDDLLDIARISGDKLELKKTRADLNNVLSSAIETSLPIIEAGRHALHIDMPAQPLMADVDVTRIAQVVANLLNNAAKYTPACGSIGLAMRREGDEALISVTDTGVGIPADALTSVFDMFSQIGRSLDRAQGGLGIGLSLVRRLVEMHAGTVTATSAGPGAGSTFTVRLPLAQAAERDDRALLEERSAPGAVATGIRVLVVDDNIDAALTLSMILDMSGHTTRMAHDGIEAIDVLGAFTPQLAFLDIGMPRMNGYDTAKAIRQLPGMEHITLVALTGWGADDDRTRSSEAGFDHHLTKPVQLADVERILAGLS
jgi:PAS domain S-box-containing protein